MFWWSGKVSSDSLLARSQTLAVLSRLAVDETLAVGREGDAEDPVGVVLDGVLELAGAATVPDADQAIAAAGRELLAVGADRQGQHGVLGLEQLLDQTALSLTPSTEVTPPNLRRAGVDVVDADVAFLAGPAAGDGELAVGQEQHGMGRSARVKMRRLELAGGASQTVSS